MTSASDSTRGSSRSDLSTRGRSPESAQNPPAHSVRPDNSFAKRMTRTLCRANRFAWQTLRVTPTFVIPGRRVSVEPGIHFAIEYAVRWISGPAPKGASRNDGGGRALIVLDCIVAVAPRDDGLRFVVQKCRGLRQGSCRRPRRTSHPRLGSRWRCGSSRAYCRSMISAQTRSAFAARENRYPLFRIML